MKKLFFICLLFACHLLFAKDKAFYEKKYSVSFLGFYESSNLNDTNDYKYYIAIYDYIAEDETVVYEIYCNNYDKIQDYFYKVREKGLSFKKPYFHYYVDACTLNNEFTKYVQKESEIVNIEEVYKNKNIGKDKQTIIDYHVFVLN